MHFLYAKLKTLITRRGYVSFQWKRCVPKLSTRSIASKTFRVHQIRYKNQEKLKPSNLDVDMPVFNERGACQSSRQDLSLQGCVQAVCRLCAGCVQAISSLCARCVQVVCKLCATWMTPIEPCNFLPIRVATHRGNPFCTEDVKLNTMCCIC